MKLFLLISVCLLAACTGNTPIRDGKVKDCDTIASCSNSYYEIHPDYEVGFVEYSERGNDFDPTRTQKLLDRLKRYSAAGKLSVIVFVHGWKHNSEQHDENVISFTKALSNLAKSGVLTDRKLVGIYVGWRGLTLHGLGSENITYWDRKAVAEEVGRGGVTELFTQLERIDRSRDENYLAIVGHSFGGAITLSALHDQLLERLQDQQAGLPVRAFGDAVIMLNPAIEANQGLLLKENSLKVGASGVKAQPLLYVISSQGDKATGLPFRVGQWLGVNLTWSQIDLQRNYNGKMFRLKEETLDTTTIGNYRPFHTTWIRDPERKEIAETRPASTNQFVASNKVVESTKFGDWELENYCASGGVSEFADAQRIPCYSNEPVSFIYAAESFIKNHNDVFNPAVIAFISTAVSKAYYETTHGAFQQCRARGGPGGEFLFSACFEHHFSLAKQMAAQQEHQLEQEKHRRNRDSKDSDLNKENSDAAI